MESGLAAPVAFGPGQEDFLCAKIKPALKHRKNCKSCPKKSSLNVNHVFPVCPVCLVRSVWPVGPIYPTCPVRPLSGISLQRLLLVLVANFLSKSPAWKVSFAKEFEVVHKQIGGYLIPHDLDVSK